MNTNTVEIVPGKVAEQPALPQPPKMGFYTWIAQGGGLFKPQLQLRERYVRLTPSTVKSLALGCEYRSLRRLVVAGFVEGCKVSPGCWMFNVESYFAHVERVKNDPEFWDKDNPDRNYQKYMSTCDV